MNNETPFHQPEPVPLPPQRESDKIADALLRVVMLIISLASLGAAMFSVAYVAFQFLVVEDSKIRENIFPVFIVITLAYAVGWLVALFGIRFYHNLILPIVINIYALATLAGISLLYIEILQKLYKQQYHFKNFAKYTVLVWVMLAGLIGLHLLIEGHNLRLFSMPILLIALAHLFLIVYHYVFTETVDYKYLGGDIVFFFGMTTIGLLMLLHVGIFSGARNAIDHFFENKSAENTRPL